VSASAIERRGDSVVVTAALAPGEKQLTLEYQIPAGKAAVELPVSGSGVSLNVMAEEPEVTVQGAGLSLRDSQMIQGRSFRRWSGTAQAPGMIRIQLPRAMATPRWILFALVGVLAVVLLGSGWYTLSRRGRASAVAPADDLVTAIAALDLRYQGREQEVSTEEWSIYRDERARLKAELEASLAAGARRR
jgi:hypothetical protein